MKEDPNIHTIDKEAIPLHVWESLAAAYRRDYDADVEICWIWLDK